MSSLPLKRGIIQYRNDDDYETTEKIWKCILPFISLDKIIYEPFFSSGRSKDILNGLGYKNVIHEDEDFFSKYDTYKYDVIVSNPPFSIKKKIFDKLKEIDKPFIMISPVSIITKQFFMNMYKSEDISILIPRNRMQFAKKGEINGKSWFDCVFVCYKMGLGKELIFLD